MNFKNLVLGTCLVFISGTIFAQNPDPYLPDNTAPKEIPGKSLVWHDEFNIDGKPDTAIWKYENAFVRNKELQWYQPENATCLKGLLVIEARREQIKNPEYVAGSNNWKLGREYAEYTSASIQTRGKKQWQYGTYEIRARIDTSKGSWPAIWTLGSNDGWPSGGEIDIMEFYRKNNIPIILANVAWSGSQRGVAKWHTEFKPLQSFLSIDPDWPKKFHVWRMDWDSTSIKTYLDDLLLNTTFLNETVNPDGKNPFLQPHYVLLNLAVGSSGGDPSESLFPIKYEVDYVRVYQTK